MFFAVRSSLASLAMAVLLVGGCSRAGPESRPVSELETMLKSDDATQREQGVIGLSRLGSDARSAAPALIAALQSPDLRVRETAAGTLGHLAPEATQAIPPLTKALDDPEWSVRHQAAIALGNFGPAAKMSADSLRRLESSDPRTSVRKAAKESLARISAK